jgi:hypothetical protein
MARYEVLTLPGRVRRRGGAERPPPALDSARATREAQSAICLKGGADPERVARIGILAEPALEARYLRMPAARIRHTDRSACVGACRLNRLP